MQISIDIPDEIASRLSEMPEGLGRAAMEALALEGVRSGRLTEYEARVMLGIPTRYDMDVFLKLHDILLPETIETVTRDTEIAATFLRR